MARRPLTRGAAPARTPRRKPRLLVDRSGDRFEREADRAADRVVMGASPRFRLSAVPVERVQRQDAPGAQGGEGAPKTDEEKYALAAKKVAQAFAKTPQGQAIIDGIASDPLVKRVTDAGEAFVGSTPGKIVTGAAAVGAVAALAATHESLPIGIPDVPLEKVSPRLAGWTMQITWEGPVDRPTRAMVGFSFSGRSGKKRPAAVKPSETDRPRAGGEKSRAGTSDVAGSADARQRAMQDDAVRAVVARHAGLGAPGAGIGGPRAGAAPLGPGFLPSIAPLDPARMPRPADASAVPAGAVPKDEEPVMRRADGARADAAPGAQAAVESVLASPGQALDRTTRTAMESRFGFDFGDVRVHADGAAGESARAIGAVAYSAGRDIVFSAGAYAPSTPGGQWLLAHELAHVIQQGAGTDIGSALTLHRKGTAPPRPDPLGTALRGDDDDTRALTQSQGWNTLTLAPRDAATLLSHLLEGATWDDDERAGLRILRKMIAEDLLDETLEELAAQRRFGQLLDDYDGSEYGQLLDLLSSNIKTPPVAVKLLDKFISMWWLNPREQRAVVVLIEHVPPSQRTAVLQGGKNRVDPLRRHIDQRGTAVAFERLLASEEFTRWQALSGQLSNVFTIKAEASVGRGQRTRAEADELLKKAAEDLAAELLEYRDRLKQAGDRPDALAKVNKEYMRRIDSLVGDKSREFDLELRYNLEFDRLLMDLRGNRVTYGRPWQARDLEALDAALSKIPRDLVRNSGVRVIARATYDPADPTVAGLAQESIGRIQLRSSLPAGDDDARWFFFESTAHEIGHFAEGADQPKAGDNAARHQSTGLARDFMALSEWSYLDRPALAQAVPDQRARDELQSSLDADYGKHQKDSKFEGEDHRHGDYVYRFSRYQGPGNYVRRRHGAKFVRDYAATDPSDDFADTFGYFFAGPNYLRERAPEKYEFMLVRVMTDYRLHRQAVRVLDEMDRIFMTIAPPNMGVATRLYETFARPLLESAEVQLNGVRAIRTAEATRTAEAIRTKKQNPKPVTMEAEAEQIGAPFLTRARRLMDVLRPALASDAWLHIKRDLVRSDVSAQQPLLLPTFREVANELERQYLDRLVAVVAPLAERAARGEDVAPPASWRELDVVSGKYEVALTVVPSYLPAYDDSSIQQRIFRHIIVAPLAQTVTDEARLRRIGPKLGVLPGEFDAEMERWRENARARMLAGQTYSRQAVERPVEARERYARRAREIVRTTK